MGLAIDIGGRGRLWGFFAASPLLQELPPRSYTGADTVAWLRDSLLTLRLDGTAAADVSVSGAPAGPDSLLCVFDTP